MKILVIKPSSLGDVIHALPAVTLLRQTYPEALIAWVVNEEFATLVERFTAVNTILPFRRKRWGQLRYWPELPAAVKNLRRQQFDMAIDFQGLFRSGLIGYLSGAPRRIGFTMVREGAALFYTEKISVPATIKHAVEKNLHLVRAALGITAATPEAGAIRPDPAATAAVAGLLAQNGLAGSGPLVAVAPAARWPAKMWPPEFFIEVICELRKQQPSARIWLAGSRSERALGDRIREACAGRTEPPCNLMGCTGLSELVELLGQSRVLLTNDSGPMHLAAVMNCPTVALFGPTDPVLTGPYGRGHTVFCGDCPQAPCFKFNCPLQTRICTRMPRPEAVAEAMMKSLG